MVHNYIPLLASINPQNVVNITLALFYITAEEVRHKYSTVALYLMGKLIKRYERATEGKLTPKKAKALVRIARAMVMILKPSAKEKIKNSILQPI